MLDISGNFSAFDEDNFVTEVEDCFGDGSSDVIRFMSEFRDAWLT